MSQPFWTITDPKGRARRIVAIVNPATRRPANRIVSLLRERLPAGVDLDVRLTERAGETSKVARAALPGSDLIVAVGGDGTVAAIASALGEARAAGQPDIPLAIIPAGSTNITARELRVPLDPSAAIDLLYGRRPQTLTAIDLGRCGDERFLHMAGAGLDSRLFAETDPALKRRVGWLAYLPPTVRNLRQRPARFRIVADPGPDAAQPPTELVVDSPLVIVANGGAIIAARFQLFPDIQTDDGWLDVLVFTPRGLPAVLRTLARTVTMSLHRSPFALRLRARRVEIESDPSLPVQLDGDIVTKTPAIFSVQPAALHVVVPGSPEQMESSAGMINASTADG